MAERRALIGHSGFVGGFLDGVMPFAARYRSSTIQNIAGESFDTIVCAGVSAVKWMANKQPDRDRAGIALLEKHLDRVRTRRFIHISTADVFGAPEGVDETSPVPTEGLHPYGLHRYQLEQFLRERFGNLTILRLPGLFGPGLRKNILFDLLNDHLLEQIPRASAFQWYDLRRLPGDMERAEGLDLVHLVPEPLPTRRILEGIFPDKAGVGHDGPGARYDLRTVHAARFGGEGPYIASADEVFDSLKAWVDEERATRAQAA